MFKIGDEVVCIDDRIAPTISLSKGLIYTVKDVLHVMGTYVIVLVEDPHQTGWSMTRFELVKPPIDYLAITREFG